MGELSIYPKIAVLMSTYNGELYIKEQIESILRQKNVEVYLYIRDDGSTDRTEQIVRKYTGENNVFYKKGKQNLGPGKSFMHLLYTVGKIDDYQYYAFADQDDIWLEEKLISAVNMLDNDYIPQLYCSNQIIYENEREKGLRFKELPDLSLIGHLTRSDISGCTMVLNRRLAEEIIKKKCPERDILNLRLHDTFIFLTAALIGEIKYDNNSYIRYRIHADNTVGIKKKTVFGRIGRALKRGMPYKNLRMKTAKFLLDNYSICDQEQREIVEKFATYRSGLSKRIKLIKDGRVCKASGEKRWLFILKVLINYL